MSGLPEEDDEICDSRTASVGQPRSRNGGISNSHNESDTSGDKPERKRARRDDGADVSISQDTAPVNAEGDSKGDSNSSSGQESESDNGGNEPRAQGVNTSRTQPPVKGSLPAVQWNKGSRSAIRTTLGGKRSASGAATPNQGQTEAVAETAPGHDPLESTPDRGNHNTTAQSGTHDPESTAKGPGSNVSADEPPPHTMSISDGSESGEVTEGDDDIVLNLSDRNEGSAMRGDQTDRMEMPSEKVQHSPSHHQGEQANGNQTQVNGTADSRRADTNSKKDTVSSHPTDPSKENAIQAQSLKYRAQPTVLGDLSRDDLEIQAKYIFYKLDVRDIDLSLPVKCINCRKEGHLADVCPDKECEHCGAWELHESCFCPSWRRCQKCRERGHDKESCTSRLMGSAMEVPCDRCGSSDHLESDCDLMWKSPWPYPVAGPITVSISCSNCKSRQHLIGDCPSLRRPLGSSSFTLKHYDPSMINEPSMLSGGNTRPVFTGAINSGMRIRGRAEARTPSPESDMRSGQRYPVRKNATRSHIRFAPDIGRGWDSRDGTAQNQDDHYPSSRNEYRDRDEFIPNNTRQRSLSPDPRPVNRRGRGDRNGDNRRPPPRERSQSRGRGPQQPPKPPKSRGKFSARGQSKRAAANGDAYRPLPGAAKKAWDKHRVG